MPFQIQMCSFFFTENNSSDALILFFLFIKLNQSTLEDIWPEVNNLEN